MIVETRINAPAEVCFDLMRDIRIHTETTAQTNEKAVGGVTDGKMELGQTVTFEGIHFGVRQRLTVKVIEYDPPRRFVDEMIAGRFRSFIHIHEFEPIQDTTLLRDTLIWESPFGPIGKAFDKLVLERYMRRLVATRNVKLKSLAESSRQIEPR